MNNLSSSRTLALVHASLKRRHKAEKRFRLFGLTAVVMGLGFVTLLFVSIISKGYTAFTQTYLQLPIHFDAALIDPEGQLRQAAPHSPQQTQLLAQVNVLKLARSGLTTQLSSVQNRRERRLLYGLLSPGAPQQIREQLAAHPEWIGQTRTLSLLADDDVDMFIKGHGAAVNEYQGTVALSITPYTGDQLTMTAVPHELIATITKNQFMLDANTNTKLWTATTTAPSYLLRTQGGVVKVLAITGSETMQAQILVPFTQKDDANTAQTWQLLELTAPESDRRLSDLEIAWIWQLQHHGLIKKQFNQPFFTNGTSREPELAGIAGALIGSLYTLALTLVLSFPIGVGAAVYLEEFAPRNRWTDFIEVNINNLAAVPSIVFGLLGLAVFINFFGVPRSTPLVAALVLTLMTLPTIIIASRAALKSVPPSIREAALGVGASPLQTQLHHVLPLALPGMLTGTIIGMAQALGETAPLLMIGMIAFIVDIPASIMDPSTVLPVQIFLWADSPERGFVERTSAAIMVLLGFLIIMNLTAVLLRRRFERRW
jgi:phosphate transport system permease protein